MAAERFDVPHRYADHGELLADPAVDAVVVCVPAGLHAAVALDAPAAGKHVLVEKPLALALDDADRLVERASAARVQALVGHNLRWHRLVRRARALVAAGAVGEPEVLRTALTSPFDYRPAAASWRFSRDAGGGSLVELATHHFDLWSFLLGDAVVEVTALSRSEPGEVRAAGIRAARAPVVVLGETHAFPERGWASALLAAHDEPCAAVAPCVANANPSTAMSWANFFLDYGPWSELPERAELADLPGHNSSYKRDLLLELGDRLDPLLEAETFLHQELRSRGHRLLIEPAARLRHVNVSRWRWFLFERFSVGQRFGGARAQGFPRWRRAVYAAGSPLIPAVRLPRVLRDVLRSGRRAELLPAILPTLLLGLVLSALGELAGYLAGPGASAERLSRIELYKQRYVRPEERRAPASRG